MQHVALARLHVLQSAEPFAATLAVGGEHGERMLVLHHVAGHGLVEVVCQSCLDGQAHHRCVANAVPSLLHLDGAVGLPLVGAAPDLYLLGRAHLHAVAVLLRQLDAADVRIAVAHPLTIAVGQRQVFRVLRQDVALLPREAAQDALHAREGLVIDVERHPVPASCQVELLQVLFFGV